MVVNLHLITVGTVNWKLDKVYNYYYCGYTHHVYRIPAVVSQPDRRLHSHRQGHTLQWGNCCML